MAFQQDSIFWVEVEKIVPNPYQPRREFDEAKLKELAESVRMYGILQPLTVTRKEIQGEDGSFRSEYELIAGERRLRASKIAGLQLVPVIIRDSEQTEQEKLELAIIENLQREDLNAVDRALAFRQLADVFGLSHSQVAQKVGRSREYVSNSIRLLALPEYMLASVRTNDITEGHARTLLMLNDRPEEQDVVFREILLKKLSVREVEKIARSIATEKVRKQSLIDPDILDMEKQFTDTLGTRVSITKTEYGGRLTIDYFSQEDLEEMLRLMKQEAKAEPIPAVYKDESNDTFVSAEVDEAVEALKILSATTALESTPTAVPTNDVVVETVPVVESAPAEVSDLDTSNAISEVPPTVVPDGVPMVTAVAPVVPAAFVAPTPAEKPASTNRLREQLAALLRPNTTPAVATQNPVQPTATETPKATTTTPASTDESDLYSVYKFTI